MTSNAYDLTIDGPPEMPDDGTFRNFSTLYYESSSSYFWTVPNGWGISSGQGTTHVQLYANPGASDGYVSVSTQICGTNASEQKYMNIGDGGGSVELGINPDHSQNRETHSSLLYPNPMHSTVEVVSDNGNIKYIEVLGLFSSKPLIVTNKNQQINVNSLANGIYLIRITYENGYTELNKMIKQ